MAIKVITLLNLRDIIRRRRLSGFICYLIPLIYSSPLILGALGCLRRLMVKK
jgi:hypothetical protein